MIGAGVQSCPSAGSDFKNDACAVACWDCRLIRLMPLVTNASAGFGAAVNSELGVAYL
jgi:hypothetical protein